MYRYITMYVLVAVLSVCTSVTAQELGEIRSQGLWHGSFSPDGQLLATRTKTGIKLWDVKSRRELAVLKDEGMRCFCFAPDGKTIAMGCADRTIKLWDVTEQRLRKTLKGPTGLVCCVTFSPDGRKVASGCSDGSVTLWDVETGKGTSLGKSGQSVDRVVFSPDGKTLTWPSMTGSALALILGTSVKLTDVTTGKIKGSVHDMFGADRLAFSPDGKMLATSSVSPRVNIWDAAKLKQHVQFKASDHVMDERVVMEVAYVLEGKAIMTADRIGSVRFWDAANGKEIAALKTHPIAWLAVSLDGKMLAYAFSQGPDTVIKLWDVVKLIFSTRRPANEDSVAGRTAARTSDLLEVDRREENPRPVVPGIVPGPIANLAMQRLDLERTMNRQYVILCFALLAIASGCSGPSPVVGTWIGKIEIDNEEKSGGLLGIMVKELVGEIDQSGPCTLNMRNDGTGFLKLGKNPERPITWTLNEDKVTIRRDSSGKDQSKSGDVLVVATIAADKQSITLEHRERRQLPSLVPRYDRPGNCRGNRSQRVAV